MRTLLIVVSVLFTASGTVHEAFAAKYVCKGNEYQSRVGASETRRITIEHNKSKKLCLFSVDGWPASSPPSEQVKGAFSNLNQLLAKSKAGGSINVDTSALAFALSAATSNQTPRGAMFELLKRFDRTINKCFEALVNSTPTNKFKKIDDIPISCGVYKGGQVAVGEGLFVLRSTDRLVLIIGASMGETSNALIIPKPRSTK
jgi:hypothetical protein